MRMKWFALGFVAFIAGVVAAPFMTTAVSARHSAPEVYTAKTLNFNPASDRDIQAVGAMLTDMAKQGWTYVDRDGAVFVFRK